MQVKRPFKNVVAQFIGRFCLINQATTKFADETSLNRLNLNEESKLNSLVKPRRYWKMTKIEEIREAAKKGELTEPFGKKDLDRVFPDWPEGTRKAYLYKHYVGAPRPYKEYFQKVAPGKFRLIKKR